MGNKNELHTTDKMEAAVSAEFRKRFAETPVLVRSPGRVNLIGEHTDYNEGFVLPAAIDKAITMAVAPNESDNINLVAIDMNETCSRDLSGPIGKSDKGWPNYILGVVQALRQSGCEIRGFDCVFGGDIPIGAGLSSSAALEGGIVYGLSVIFDLDLSRKDMALTGQKAENEFVGVRCGIMDQFVNLYGKPGQALKLDCRSLEYEFYPFARDDVDIVLCNTRVKRELASSEYNIRRRQCEQGVELLSKTDSSIRSLRDADFSMLEKHKEEMDPVIYKRCRYVLEENRRVENACEDLAREEIASFGKKMYASHNGLRDLYEVSCEELDILVEETQTIEGVLGARMMGGGFGGCTINLVERSAVDSFSAAIGERYRERTGKEIEVYLTRIAGGVRLIEPGEMETAGR